MKKDPALTYSLTLRLLKNERFLGPGVVTILELIEREGSLNKAAQTMAISYNKAWRIVQRAESQWDRPLLETKVGGPCGGGSKLTPDAKVLLTKYHQFETTTYQLVDQVFNEIFQEFL